MVKQQTGDKKKLPPFRFLKADEYAALPHEERLKYLQDAIDALKSGRPLAMPAHRSRH